MLGKSGIPIAVYVCAALTGCQAARKQPNGEMSTLLQTVSYAKHETTLSETSANTTEWTEPSLSDNARTLGTEVREGLVSTVKFTGKLVARAGLQMLNPMNYFDQDDSDRPDTSTARGRADRNFNKWLEQREEWQKKDRR